MRYTHDSAGAMTVDRAGGPICLPRILDERGPELNKIKDRLADKEGSFKGAEAIRKGTECLQVLVRQMSDNIARELTKLPDLSPFVTLS